MDAIQRVTNVLRGKVPDRVPTALHGYLMACRMHGGRFDEILRDGAAMAEAQLNMWRTFRQDVIMLETGVCAAAEALGCAIRYPLHGPPHVEEPLIKQPEDIEKLRVPDPERTFPLDQLLETTRIVKKELGSKAYCTVLRRAGGFAFVHACGHETIMLENLLAAAADCLELDPETDAEICKQTVQGRATVLGLIHPTEVMRFGTPDTVREQAKQMLATMAPGGGFIVGPGCALPADTPPENVHALMEYVWQEGVYGEDGGMKIEPH